MEVSISNFALISCQYIDEFNFMGEHLCFPEQWVGINGCWIILCTSTLSLAFLTKFEKLISFFHERERDIIKTIIIFFQKMVYRHLYSAKWQVSLKKMD